MANKASFSAEEWSRVVAYPINASTAITAAEPSGLWGHLQEGMAGGWALLKAKQDTTNALVKAVVDDFANGDARTMAQERVQTVLSAELQLAIPKRRHLPKLPLRYNLLYQKERRFKVAKARDYLRILYDARRRCT